MCSSFRTKLRHRFHAWKKRNKKDVCAQRTKLKYLAGARLSYYSVIKRRIISKVATQLQSNQVNLAPPARLHWWNKWINYFNIEPASRFYCNAIAIGKLNPLVVTRIRLMGLMFITNNSILIFEITSEYNFQTIIHYCLLETIRGFNFQIQIIH